MTTDKKLTSRLEINYARLLEEAQKMAAGDKKKGWLFESNRNLTILYGSETGTAQDVAERIARESYRNHFLTSVSCLNDMKIEDLSKKELAVFVVATTGQGDDPENMKEFFKSLWSLRRNRELLSGLSFGIMGLGDSSYQKFNFAAKRLNKLLMLVGAKSLCSIGLADDQHDLGADYVIDSWLKEWWTKLTAMYPIPDGVSMMDPLTLLPPKFRATFTSDRKESPSLSMDLRPQATVHSNVRVTSADHFQDVRLINFDVTNISTKHKPGDVLVIQPENLQENVTKFLDLLQLDGDAIFSLEPWSSNTQIPPKYMLPQPCTIEECVRKYLDIQSIPKRVFFEILSVFATDELQKEKFIEFTTTAGQEELHNYCTRPRRTIVEVLADFPGLPQQIPFDYLFDLIPPIRPRSYSIASSALAIPNHVEILVAKVEFKTNLKAPRHGLCSSWLSTLKSGDQVFAWIKPGSLIFPEHSPVLMIGPGTGCAPFRSFIQERIALNGSHGLSIVFGCRNQNKDFFFKNEWEKLEKEGSLSLFTAFSRDQPEKIYIQHVMRNNAALMWEIISNNRTQIFYAGNAKRIPIDVHEALEYICQEGGHLTEEETKLYMKNNIEKRYQSESWA